MAKSQGFTGCCPWCCHLGLYETTWDLDITILDCAGNVERRRFECHHFGLHEISYYPRWWCTAEPGRDCRALVTMISLGTTPLGSIKWHSNSLLWPWKYKCLSHKKTCLLLLREFLNSLKNLRESRRKVTSAGVVYLVICSCIHVAQNFKRREGWGAFTLKSSRQVVLEKTYLRYTCAIWGTPTVQSML